MNCEVPNCHRRSRYIVPGFWCGTHWKVWWNHGTLTPGKPQPKWMRRPESWKKCKKCKHWKRSHDKDGRCLHEYKTNDKDIPDGTLPCLCLEFTSYTKG